MPISLGDLATQFGCELIGDPDISVSRVASLQSADSESLSFLSSSSYSSQLPSTKAAAVILRPDEASNCPVAALLSDNPYATYAEMAAVVCPEPEFDAGVHPSAVIAPTAEIAASACIGASAVIGDGVSIGENSFVGPGCVVDRDSSIGSDCRLVANVTLVKNVTLGDRCILHPGVVVGADGFGNAMTPDGWVKVPQVGGVRVGNDVEIGSNTTIDCGAIGDTEIGNGVRIDNLCMIAHNVKIGDHSALAGMTGIAGSTVVGKRCLFAGKSGAVGHVNICDDVVVGAKTFISKDVTEPGTYVSSFPAEKANLWSRQLARFRRLDKLIERVTKLEK